MRSFYVLCAVDPLYNKEYLTNNVPSFYTHLKLVLAV